MLLKPWTEAKCRQIFYNILFWWSFSRFLCVCLCLFGAQMMEQSDSQLMRNGLSCHSELEIIGWIEAKHLQNWIMIALFASLSSLNIVIFIAYRSLRERERELYFLRRASQVQIGCQSLSIDNSIVILPYPSVYLPVCPYP